MKKAIILCTSILLFSCSEKELKGEETVLANLKKPIVVIAKDPKYSIVVQDSVRKVVTIDNKTFFGTAMVKTYSLGDTLR